ncbi:MAG: glycosyltransferase family 39 protein [Candidatus Scalindua rubra]|uniref:Dolichyl-phosphate-mannose-protein mannosyltransferase n=1 Tax=Candidatus Scalindua brodae TaxID=237368 RepID=A0A0B0EKJ1_9BACT|nr:MAG: Dolichyl-phosphate-mannose-protein mannosyltransferase [Candidatus Scalindua brodae]MBZ0107149.1 glycosyltransferase family 39 protein [Candidatus Scalindua rubra]TWU38082.1 Dolichyl-phosphate-mannose-protein mannosyltransferase [Candidatus Brocadiaceae bacterium S225]
MLNKNTIYAILIIFAGFLARLINITQPILEVAGWRQCITASIAREFYYHGMNIFYPRVQYGGNIEGYIGGTEFNLYPFTVAFLYKLFGVHESLGRLVSIIAFCGSAYFLYKLTRKYAGGTSALITLLFYTFNPYIFFYSRSFQPESTMLFFSITMLYFFSEWIEKENWWRFTLMTLCATLAFLTKLPTICLGLPLLYLCLKKYKLNFIVQWKLWLFAILSLLFTFLWYRHSNYIKTIDGGITMNSLSFSYYMKYSVYFLTNLHFYQKVFYAEVFEKDLIYVGGLFFVLGIIFTLKKKEFRYIHYWLLAIIIYFFLAAKEVEWHTYYTIPIIVPASVYIGYAISNSLKLITAYKITGIRKIVLQSLFVIMVVSLPLISFHKITGRYKSKRLEKDYPVQVAGKIVDETARENDLVIGCIWGGPELIYYCNRRGWAMNANACSIASIENLRQSGADFFVTTKQDVIDRSVLDYLKNNYEIINSTEEYLIIKF